MHTPPRDQIGGFWLDHCATTRAWLICWNDEHGVRRAKPTGVIGDTRSPPAGAQQLLAEHYLAAHTSRAGLADIVDHWLTHQVAKKGAPARFQISVEHFARFLRESVGTSLSELMASDVTRELIDGFIGFRQEAGVTGATISRDLAALRAALNWGERERLIEKAPFVHDVAPRDRALPRDLVYSSEQIAALLEAAARLPERRHVLLYALIALSTCGRSKAILDLHSDQVSGGMINFLVPGEHQTSKRRSIVPIAPTLAPWLTGITGKIITYRAQLAERRWAQPGVPDYFVRPCADIGKAFNACLVEAGICRLDGVDAMGARGLGTPNTLRHTAITEMHRRGVDERQIELAAGHAPLGTNKRNYMHLRPDYLAGLIDAVEGFWADLDRLTTVHRDPRGRSN